MHVPTLCVWLHLKQSCLCHTLCSGAAKMEDAADLFVRAANTFKVAKKWKGNVLYTYACTLYFTCIYLWIVTGSEKLRNYTSECTCIFMHMYVKLVRVKVCLQYKDVTQWVSVQYLSGCGPCQQIMLH